MRTYTEGLLHEPDNQALSTALTAVKAETARGKNKGAAPGTGVSSETITKFLGNGYFSKMISKLLENRLLSRIIMYVIVFAGMFGYNRFFGSPKEDKGNTPVDDAVNKAVDVLQHRIISVGSGPQRVLHLVKRPAIIATTSSDHGALGEDTSTSTSDFAEALQQTSKPISSLLFFHTTGLSLEEFSSHIYEEFPDYNIVGVDLPCHGRSGCFVPTGDDWEEIGKKIATGEGKFLGDPKKRVMFLSGYSPFVTRAMYDALEPAAVVWTSPSRIVGTANPTDDQKEIATFADLKTILASGVEGAASTNRSGKETVKEKNKKKEASTSSNSAVDDLPIPILRDAMIHLAHAKRPQYTVESNVTELVLNEVIEGPTLVLEDEHMTEMKLIVANSLRKEQITVEPLDWRIVKTEAWLSKVNAFLDKTFPAEKDELSEETSMGGDDAEDEGMTSMGGDAGSSGGDEF
ncbi:unnamed protein product [Amoebophrya sp. A25]|nr:unnamed protein product [Amoebophrya sp. A25]|eukprot:GSA25T00002475001.1